MIIKLTEMRKDGPYPTYVNMDHVQYFSKSMNGADTRLKIAGDNLYLFVKESVEEIRDLMVPKMVEAGEFAEFTEQMWNNLKPGTIERIIR